MLISPISNTQFTYQNANKAKYSNNTKNNSSNISVANNQVAFTGLQKSFCDILGILPKEVTTIEEAIAKLLNKNVKKGQFIQLTDGSIINGESNKGKSARLDNITEVVLKGVEHKISKTCEGDEGIFKFRSDFSASLIASFLKLPNLKKVTVITNEHIKELAIPLDKASRENALKLIENDHLYTHELVAKPLDSLKYDEYFSRMVPSLVVRVNQENKEKNLDILNLVYTPIK